MNDDLFDRNINWQNLFGYNDINLDDEVDETELIKSNVPELSFDLKNEINELIAIDARPKFDIEGPNLISGTLHLYSTTFTIKPSTIGNKSNWEETGDIKKLLIFFLIDYKKRINYFSENVSIRVKVNPVDYFTICSFKNKHKIQLNELFEFIERSINLYQSFDLNCLQFSIVEHKQLFGNGLYNIYNFNKLIKNKQITNRNFILINNEELNNSNEKNIDKQIKFKINKNLFYNPYFNTHCGEICLLYYEYSQLNHVKGTNSNQILYNKAIELGKELDTNGTMKLTDFDLYTNKYKKYKVIIYQSPNKILYKSEYKDNKLNINDKSNIKNIYNNENNKITINLQLLHGHYLFIKNIHKYMNQGTRNRIYCGKCHLSFTKSIYNKHNCVVYTCKSCKEKVLNTKLIPLHNNSDDKIYCTKCKRNYNPICYEKHINNICKKYERNVKCNRCNIYYNKGSTHKCNYRFCIKCNKQKKFNHRCFLSKLSINNSKNNDIYVYDIECYMNEDCNNAVRLNHSIFSIVVAKLDGNIKLNNDRLSNKLNELNNIKDNIKIFYNVNNFLKFIEKFKKITYFYAHNAKSYDNVLLLHSIYKKGSKPDNIIKNGNKIMYMKYYNVKFMDSYNHINMSLKNIGINLLKGKITKGYFPYKFFTKNNKNYIGKIPDIEYFLDDDLDKSSNNINTNNLNHIELFNWYKENKNITYNIAKECIKYCINDVLLLKNALEIYRDENIKLNGINPLYSITISSYAMKVYRTNHYKENIGILNQYEYNFAKRAFYGGRTNSLVLHKKYNKNDNKFATYIDINSLYPYIQYNYNLPIGHPKVVKLNKNINKNIKINKKIKSLKLLSSIAIINNNKLFSFVKCDIKCPTNLYLPVLVNRKNNKLMSTLVNKKKLVYTNAELKLALQYGYKITNIYEIHIYNTSKSLFKTYVDKFIRIKEKSRKTNDVYKEKISKLMLNSLWGKFAQRRNLPKSDYIVNNQEWLYTLSKHYRNEIELKDFYLIEDYMYIKYLDNIKSNRNEFTGNIALSAAITSYARVYLYQELIKLNYKVLYFDTDSIIYENDKNNLYYPEISDKLGKWKIEGDNIKEFISIGPKSYICVFNDGTEIKKCKGFNANWIKKEDYLELIYSNKEKIKYKDEKIKISKDKIYTSINDKCLRLSYNKRRLANNIELNNIQTIPFGFKY